MPGPYFPAATGQGGMAMAMPDVCLVPAPPAPPIPTPFPNMAQCPMAPPVVATVLFSNMPVIVQSSQIPLSSGDEAGVNGGVASGMFIGPCTFKTTSMRVKAGGQGIVLLTSVTGHNGMSPNTVGTVQVPSQAKVLVGM